MSPNILDANEKKRPKPQKPPKTDLKVIYPMPLKGQIKSNDIKNAKAALAFAPKVTSAEVTFENGQVVSNPSTKRKPKGKKRLNRSAVRRKNVIATAQAVIGGNPKGLYPQGSYLPNDKLGGLAGRANVGIDNPKSMNVVEKKEQKSQVPDLEARLANVEENLSAAVFGLPSDPVCEAIVRLYREHGPEVEYEIGTICQRSGDNVRNVTALLSILSGPRCGLLEPFVRRGNTSESLYFSPTVEMTKVMGRKIEAEIGNLYQEILGLRVGAQSSPDLSKQLSGANARLHLLEQTLADSRRTAYKLERKRSGMEQFSKTDDPLEDVTREYVDPGSSGKNPPS